MPIAVDEVECSIQESSLGPGSRHFFEAMALPNLKQARSHALKLDELVISDGQTDSWLIWSLTFHYQGHSFLIDTNDHAGLSQFYVADPECSIDILLHVLDHFQRLSILRWRFDDECHTTGHQLASDTFFHSRRRKAGIVMLALACVLMVMWVRSQFYCDLLAFGYVSAVSQCGEISIGGNTGPFAFDLSTGRLTDVITYMDVNGKVIETYPMRWRHPGPAMPHWLIAGPLGLLSAYLILWKPRKRVSGDA
ncbi:MAG: hypothetical protein JWP89_3633 [Schlesneria sp.]|nr:hypothetical protein [Schlesneria sp.]